MTSDSIARAAMKARLMAEAEAKIERDLALAEQLAAQYPDLFKIAMPAGHSTAPAAVGVQQPTVNAQPQSVMVEGSVADLINRYRTDEQSPYPHVRFATRENYESMCRRIENDHGDVMLSSLSGRDLLRWHAEWSAEGRRIALAHGLIGMTRRLFTFGATVLENPDCQRLSGIASQMRFKMPKRRTAQLTIEHVNAIREAAHKMGFPSIALAQAFQYEAELAQKDCVGEYVPIAELIAPSEFIVKGKIAWQRGIRWSEIDQNMILRHTASRDQVLVEIDLRKTHMIREELARFKGDKSKDPIVIYEKSGKPYLSHQFRRTWRKIATAAGVPPEIENRDTKNETPASRRALHVSPSKGNRLANDPSAQSLETSRLKGTTSERP